MEALFLNVCAIISISSLVAYFFAEVGDRAVYFIMTLWTLVAFSIVGWIIFVIVHFLGKVW